MNSSMVRRGLFILCSYWAFFGTAQEENNSATFPKDAGSISDLTNNYSVITLVSEQLHPKPRENLVQYTRLFTSYHLYFRTDARELRQQCTQNDWLDLSNTTFLNSVVDHCPNYDYYPLHVLRSQISWKPSPPKTEKGSATSNANKDSTSGDHNGSAQQYSASNATQESNNKKADDHESDYHVHKYLIIALLLPNHPYSDEMFRSIRRVAPMFPMVSVVTGDGYEFRDIAAKYFVSTMPTMILFKNGLYFGDTSVRDEVGLAVKLAKWTKSPPRSLPLSVSMNVASPSTMHVQLPSTLVEKDHHWLVLSLMQRLQQALNMVPLPYPNLEPFVGSMPRYREIDLFFFLLSGIYCLGRLIYFVRSYVTTR